MDSKKSVKKGLIYLLVVVILTNVLAVASTVVIMKLAFYPTANPPSYNFDGSAEEQALAAVTAKFIGNTLEITTSASVGTGIIVEYQNQKPIIITNYHVIAPSGTINEDSIRLRFYGNLGFTNRSDVSVLGFDKYNDIAVLRFNKSVKQGLDIINERKADGSFSHIATQESLAVGQRVVALGNALGKGIAASEGILSRVESYISLSDKNVAVLQTSAPINEGNSGGALFDSFGRMIAINTYQSRTTDINGASAAVDNISYSVPIDIVLPIYNNIIRVDRTGASPSSRDAELYKAKLNLNGEDFVLTDSSLGLQFAKHYEASVNNVDEIQSIVVYSKLTSFDATAQENGFFKSGDQILKIGEYDLYSGANVNTSFVRILAELYSYSKDGNGAPLEIVVKSGGSTTTLVINSFKRV